MSETTTIAPQDDSNEEPKAKVQAAPLSEFEAELLRASGMDLPVDAKDYQTNPNLAKAMMGQKSETASNEPPKVIGGGNEVFTPSSRYQQHQSQLNQTQTPEPEKRQYVHGMKFVDPETENQQQGQPSNPTSEPQAAFDPSVSMPPFDPNAGVETMSFDGLTTERPVDNSQAVNSSLNKTTAQLATDAIWNEIYPFGMKWASQIPKTYIKEIMENVKIPFSLKDKFLKAIYRFNESIEKNCYQSAKHIKEFQDALTLVLETYGYNNIIGPEGQLIYSIIKMGSVGWGQFQDNVELKEQTVIEIREEIKNFTDEQDRREAQKSQTEHKKAA